LKPLLLGGGAACKRLTRRATMDVGVMLICEVSLPECPLDRAPEASDRGTVAVMPASWQARISLALK
jgi:hypothetical protein